MGTDSRCGALRAEINTDSKYIDYLPYCFILCLPDQNHSGMLVCLQGVATTQSLREADDFSLSRRVCGDSDYW